MALAGRIDRVVERNRSVDARLCSAHAMKKCGGGSEMSGDRKKQKNAAGSRREVRAGFVTVASAIARKHHLLYFGLPTEADAQAECPTLQLVAG
jgi:hypothetical protein